MQFDEEKRAGSDRRVVARRKHERSGTDVPERRISQRRTDQDRRVTQTDQ